MITFYQYDNLRIFIKEIEQSEFLPVPKNSTQTQPPEIMEGQVAQWAGNDWEVLDERPQPTPTTQDEKLKSANAQLSADAAAIKAGYTQDEIDSWPQQLAEAEAWSADSTAETVLIDSIIEVSGETKADLVANILTKSAQFKAAFGAALGAKRKALL